MNDIDITPERIDLLMEAAAAVGKKFARTYAVVDAENLASEVTAKAMERWEHFNKKLDQAPDHGRSEYDVLHFLLSERASEYCERESYAYMITSSEVVYTPMEVRALLKEFYYNPEAYETPSKDENFGTGVEAKSVWVNLRDLKDALSKVKPKVHDIILAAFGPEDLGLPEPDHRRVGEAVDKVTEQLNRHLNRGRSANEGPGSRRAMTNSTSQSIKNEGH
ncbi:hypothetical protein [Nonomuraea sp. NPDC049129]|uniref:hypothetical protein n=1 Tax=Nonomuraea sp. NPDC049129 TaxID=3155272 RepID=UPI0033F5DA2F